jgi:TetR/AcrR family transcriptional regulator, cholesterol catabolism regulator
MSKPQRQDIPQGDSAIRERILHTAGILFERHGFRDAGMQEVASETGISTKTLYRQFLSKSELVQAYVDAILDSDRHFSEQALRTAGDPVEYQVRIVHYNYRRDYALKSGIIRELREFFPKAYSSIQDYKYKYNIQAVHHCLYWGMREGWFRSDLHVGILAKLWIEMAMVAIDLDAFHPDNYDKKQVFLELYRNYLFGIVTTEGEVLLRKHWGNIFGVPDR